MKKTIGIFLAGAALCFALDAFAQTPSPTLSNDEFVLSDAPIKHKTSRHHKKHSKKKHGKKSSHSTQQAHVRAAQGYLERLGYNPGGDDGILGPKTKTALKKFQRDHKLPATGALTTATFRALTKEVEGKSEAGSLAMAPHPDFLTTHPDFYGYYGTDGINPNTLASPQAIPSRFGTVEISQEQTGASYRYTVMLNSQPLFAIDDQPSFVNVSRTFNLDNEDDVLFTSYESSNTACPYRHHLLILRASGSGAREIADCTRDYDIYSENGMLLISFPGSHVDGLSEGDSWRYDHGTLERL